MTAPVGNADPASAAAGVPWNSVASSADGSEGCMAVVSESAARSEGLHYNAAGGECIARDAAPWDGRVCWFRIRPARLRKLRLSPQLRYIPAHMDPRDRDSSTTQRRTIRRPSDRVTGDGSYASACLVVLQGQRLGQRIDIVDQPVSYT